MWCDRFSTAYIFIESTSLASKSNKLSFCWHSVDRDQEDALYSFVVFSVSSLLTVGFSHGATSIFRSLTKQYYKQNTNDGRCHIYRCRIHSTDRKSEDVLTDISVLCKTEVEFVSLIRVIIVGIQWNIRKRLQYNKRTTHKIFLVIHGSGLKKKTFSSRRWNYDSGGILTISMFIFSLKYPYVKIDRLSSIFAWVVNLQNFFLH